MWFTTLLDKSHDAPRPFAKYPVPLMTAGRSAVLGEQNRKEGFGALPLFQKNYDFVKIHSQEHLCHKFDFGAGFYNAQPHHLHPQPILPIPKGVSSGEAAL